MNSGNAIHANTIDGCSGEGNIADFWKNHFSKLLNAHHYDATLKTSLMSKFNKVLHCNDMLIPSSLILEAIKKLECGKSAGVYAESMKFTHPRLHVVLSICFSLCFTHGYMPADMMKTTIVPTIKNKCGNLADSNNYRPIAIATIVFKFF